MPRSHKLLSFEGLRGIAAFIVVLSHLRLTFFADSASELQHAVSFLPRIGVRLVSAIYNGLLNGYFAVWLFWIMSALVLSLQFFIRANEARDLRAHDYLEDACFRRYPRLLAPVLASVAFAYTLHACGLMRNVALAHTLGEPYQSGWLGSWYTFPPSAWGALKSAAWESFFAYHSSSTYNNVLWTMEKEFYGLLFLFGFLGLLGHRRSRFIAYPVVALIIFRLYLYWLNAFVAGIFLCDLFVNRADISPVHAALHSPVLQSLRGSRLLALLLWGVVVAGAGLENYQGVSYLFLGTLAVALTLASTSTQRALAGGFPVFLGKISFGLYLIHVPIICSFSSWAYLATFHSLGDRNAALLVSAVTCIVSVAMGYLLYIAADRPGVGLSRRISALIMRKPDAAAPARGG